MAGTINVVGLPLSQKTPGVYLAVVLGGPGTSAGAAPRKLLLLGNWISSTITGATPAFTVAAGTATVNVPVTVASASDAATKFGAGSELHLMATRAFQAYSQANVTAIPTPDGTGAATGVITFTGSGPWTAAMTFRAVVNGLTCDTSIATGDTLTNIATNVATTINQQTNWPVTAQISAGVLTLSHKQTNLRGNQTTFRCFLISGTTQVKATAGALAAVLNGLTATLSSGTVVGHVYCLSSGSTEESLTTALSNVAASKFDRYACAQAGATPLGAVSNQLTSMAAVTTQLRQQGIAGNVLLASTSTTGANAVAVGLNQPRFQLCWLQSADNSTGEIAAAAAAARLIGNGAVGGVLVGEATDPAANLDGMDLPGIRAQDQIADVPVPATVEAELNEGVVPLVPSTLNPGYVRIPRSITTFWQDGAGNPNYAVIDTTDVTVPDFVADDLQSFLAITYQGFKLGPDSTDGSGPTIPNMTTPKLIRQTVLQRLYFHQANGVVINVDGHVADLNVVASPTVVGTVLMDVPVVPAPGLHVLGGNVRQLSF